MSHGARSRSVAGLSMLVALGLALAAGCGSDQAVVGGDCASGYTQVGPKCIATQDDGSVLGDDGSHRDGLVGDGTEGDDAASGDGAPGDGAQSEGSALDGNGDDTGDACPPPPYDTAAHCGDCFTVCSGINDTCRAADGGFACVPLCTAPLSECSGVCVDLTSDPANCGQCNNVCPSQICQSSACVGSTSGGIVFIGHDYQSTPAGTAQAHVLSNAVFIPQANPLTLMSYERYANANAIARVKTILTGVAQQIGRTLKITSTSTDSDITSKLTFQAFQVLLVHDQVTAPSGALATVGASWAAKLTTFTAQGGIVVVLDGGTGVAEMPSFATGTGLLNVTAQSAPLTLATPLDVIAPADTVGTGVVSPYGAGKSSVSLSTEPNGGNVIYVVSLPSDAGPGSPVVIHKVL